MIPSLPIPLLRLLPVLLASPAMAATLLDQNFATNGGFTVSNSTVAPAGPWVFNGAAGTWAANGGEGGNAGGATSILTSPVINVTSAGLVTLSFSHRYSLEPDWDGAVVLVSANGGVASLLGLPAFSQNGYNLADPQGDFTLDQFENVPVFNGDSAGYATGGFITSTASLGTFAAGSTIQLQFVGLWDNFSVGTAPNWEITSLSLVQVPEASTSGTLLLTGALAASNRRRRRTL